MNMNFQPIFNNRNDIVDAQCWPLRVGPKVVGCPEVPVLLLPPVIRAYTGGQQGMTMAFMGPDIAELAREALSKRLEDYQLEAVLGKGSFGCVYRAMDLSAHGHGKKVAIKQIPRAKVIGGDREMLFTEKRILSHLTATNSPYFTPLIESFIDPHNYTIVQGFASGGSLRGAMSNARKLFRMHEIKFLMAQLCYAVSIMQDHNVIHRDLKPDNVFMDEHGRLVIGDFGLGHMFNLLQGTGLEAMANGTFWHRTNGKCGTPGYMAPEVIRDDNYSYKIDNFSVGVMFYELVFGRLPFRGKDRRDLENRTLYGSAYIPRWFRKDYRAAFDLMRRLLAKNADHRISMRDAMKSRYFRGVNWEQVARKMQPIPAQWKTSPIKVPRGTCLSKRILIEDPYALQRWRPDPADYEFLSPRRYRPGKEEPPVIPLIFMPPPVISPDLRDERLAVGLMVKQIPERGVRSREPQDIVTIPLNEPILSPEPVIKEESEDVEMVDDSPASKPAALPVRRPLPYDFPRAITENKQDKQEDVPHCKPAAGHSMFSVCDQSLGSLRDFRSAFEPHPEHDDREGKTGFSLFDDSIVPVKEYVPTDKRSSKQYSKLFFSYDEEESPKVKQESFRVTLISTPLDTYTTLAYPSSLELLTPYRTPNNGDLTKPIDFPALWKALEGPDVNQKKAANERPSSGPLTAPSTFLEPEFECKFPVFAALDRIADFCSTPMELSD